MSGHIPCTCGNRNGLRIIKEFRNTNFSYFQSPKGQAHYSDYSTVVCINCSGDYRSKSKIINSYPEITIKEYERLKYEKQKKKKI